MGWCMYRSPGPLVHVKVRAPILEAPCTTTWLESSPSTLTKSKSHSALACISDRYCVMVVWGVMGNALATWTRGGLHAVAAALFPTITSYDIYFKPPLSPFQGH